MDNDQMQNEASSSSSPCKNNDLLETRGHSCQSRCQQRIERRIGLPSPSSQRRMLHVFSRSSLLFPKFGNNNKTRDTIQRLPQKMLKRSGARAWNLDDEWINESNLTFRGPWLPSETKKTSSPWPSVSHRTRKFTWATPTSKASVLSVALIS